ncbi:MAG TPA: ATP-binding cassette domain-containing protein [Actinomycetota bacterium]|jgi:ABC-2 type transport system ATP-binding protein|nr:ATP-binding cassette domain-containing protein [Actinomycetota bacterium]
MADDGRIVVERLTKYFGRVRAVDDLSFQVEPGTVTGFLGPNGAGKTTTLRCLLGLVTPTRGTATIGGRRYADLPDPLGTVGAALEAASFHPGRTARNHLRVLCAAARLPDARADEVLELTGLTEEANRRVRGFSMGMRQRIALAATLLGDPQVLILDEPANGLDPAGINWLRELLRHLATKQGKTVLISSHILSEVEQTVDGIVIIAQGRLIREGMLKDLLSTAGAAIRVRSPEPEKLREVLEGGGLRVEPGDDRSLLVPGATTETVGHLAFVNRIELHELASQSSDLEAVFLELTGAGGDGTRGEVVS